MPEPFDLGGALRRIRRLADLSQRQLAEAAGLSVAAVAQAETGSRGLPVAALARAARLAGLRIALVDATGAEVSGMHPDAVRDQAGRRFPAHLDTVLSEERSWRWADRRDRSQPTYTFDRRSPWQGDRDLADRPDDHLLPRPGDTPRERAEARKSEWRRRRQEELRRRVETGGGGHLPDPWTCTCPSVCDELDDRSGPPVHADDCPCRCDVG
ncbi:helix-turn-helix transcriptional regulator [Blastococcus saxobsidens]|uniref:Helix-turn-helix transcriptional regulator n=1 Tax=Blastococcus saxobsidens TaxID=138336 RepID=A0A6L9VYJ0_9ACTN|nr:helix-turn-helix transcriptional regulator [Blastococcus saxobsidens]